jgi:hypothetical protein
MSAVAPQILPRVRVVAGGCRGWNIRQEHQTAADTSMVTDTCLATCAGHRPSGRRSFRKQRTVNPVIVPVWCGPRLHGLPPSDCSYSACRPQPLPEN